MARQELPADLVTALRRARHLEVLADGLDQQRRAVAGTASIMLAAVDAGWPVVAVARAVGVRASTARARVRSARTRYGGDGRPAIVVDEPLRRGKPLDVLKQPTNEREWLTLHEAAEHSGRSLEAIRQWRRRGLLPNTQTVSPTRMLYLRADLDRVLGAPTYRSHGVDQKALLARIQRLPV